MTTLSQTTSTHDYYTVLRVDRGAPLHVIRASYRRLMQQENNHPDRGGDAAVAALINKAYAVLANAERRAAYDAELDKAAASNGAQAEAREPPKALDPHRVCVFCETPHLGGVERDQCRTCGAPLHVVTAERWEAADKRAIARVNKHLDVAVFTDWRERKGFRARTEDVSLQGVRLLSSRPLRVGQRVRIVSPMLEAVGRVSNCSERKRIFTSDYTAGVAFITLRVLQSTGGFVSRRV
ncbi:MAG: DnaJ domain-containing protein [Pseudomonadota bacterium]